MNFNEYNWWDLLQLAAILGLAWIVLLFIKELFQRTIWFGKQQANLNRITDILVLVFEPVSVILLLTTFLLINPLPHGLLLILLAAGAYMHLKNYLSGRIVRYDTKVKIGTRIQTGEIKGVISEKERLGLRLKTGRGIQYLGYSQLLQQGYVLLADAEIGGFYELKVKAQEDNPKSQHGQFFRDFLVSTPYTDRNYKPEIKSDSQGNLKIRLSVLEKTHLEELCRLISEQGYSCKVVK